MSGNTVKTDAVSLAERHVSRYEGSQVLSAYKSGILHGFLLALGGFGFALAMFVAQQSILLYVGGQ